MQLIAKAVLWPHVSLYRLTNRRIGGRFIAGRPILLLTTVTLIAQARWPTMAAPEGA